MGAARPFRQPVKCGGTRIASRSGRTAPPKRGPQALDRAGLGRLTRLQMPDHVGDVGDLLLEIALVFHEPAKPVLAAREATVPAEAGAAAEMSVTVHVLTSSLLLRSDRRSPRSRPGPG